MVLYEWRKTWRIIMETNHIYLQINHEAWLIAITSSLNTTSESAPRGFPNHRWAARVPGADRKWSWTCLRNILYAFQIWSFQTREISHFFVSGATRSHHVTVWEIISIPRMGIPVIGAVRFLRYVFRGIGRFGPDVNGTVMAPRGEHERINCCMVPRNTSQVTTVRSPTDMVEQSARFSVPD